MSVVGLKGLSGSNLLPLLPKILCNKFKMKMSDQNCAKVNKFSSKEIFCTRFMYIPVSF